jgi:hypothetical protein
VSFWRISSAKFEDRSDSEVVDGDVTGALSKGVCCEYAKAPADSAEFLFFIVRI